MLGPDSTQAVRNECRLYAPQQIVQRGLKIRLRCANSTSTFVRSLRVIGEVSCIHLVS
jgi:hypothetical protein